MKPLLLLISLAACADTIAPAKPDAGETPDPDGGSNQPTGKVISTREPDGTYTTIVDATALDPAWTHVDFETGAEVDAAAPWDLRFQRFHISTNGGVSGTAGVEVAALTNTTFAAVTAAPASGFISDAADGDDPNPEPDYAFEQGDGWYDYDVMTHVLSPKPIVWIVKTAGGATLKLEIVDYYDDAGTAAFFKLHWGTL